MVELTHSIAVTTIHVFATVFLTGMTIVAVGCTLIAIARGIRYLKSLMR